MTWCPSPASAPAITSRRSASSSTTSTRPPRAPWPLSPSIPRNVEPPTRRRATAQPDPNIARSAREWGLGRRLRCAADPSGHGSHRRRRPAHRTTSCRRAPSRPLGDPPLPRRGTERRTRNRRGHGGGRACRGRPRDPRRGRRQRRRHPRPGSGSRRGRPARARARARRQPRLRRRGPHGGGRGAPGVDLPHRRRSAVRHERARALRAAGAVLGHRRRLPDPSRRPTAQAAQRGGLERARAPHVRRAPARRRLRLQAHAPRSGAGAPARRRRRDGEHRARHPCLRRGGAHRRAGRRASPPGGRTLVGRQPPGRAAGLPRAARVARGAARGHAGRRARRAVAPARRVVGRAWGGLGRRAGGGLWPEATVLCLAAVLRLAALGRVPTNPYYDAAVRSMGTSWPAFLSGAFEPGRRVAIDKPPVDLWFQVASTRLLGFDGVALLLPEALGGIALVAALMWLLRTLLGRAAALAGGLALAVAPSAAIVARSDTMDAVMAALAVAGAAVVARATRSESRWPLVGAGVLLGLAFEVKLAEALLPVAAAAALWWFAGPRALRPRAVGLGLLGGAFVASALAWLVVVTVVPLHPRPWALGASDGSPWRAALVYNGTARLLGQGGNAPSVPAGGAVAAPPPPPAPGGQPAPAPPPPAPPRRRPPAP